MAKRLSLYIKGLIRFGYLVDIFSYCNLTANQKSNASLNYEKYCIKNGKFDHLPIIGYLFLAINRVCLAVKLYNKIQKNQVVCLVGFGWFGTLALSLAIRIRKGFIIMELNENPYSPEGGRLDPVWVRKIRRWAMLNISLKYVNGFIVISESLHNMVTERFGTNVKILRIPVLYDESIEECEDDVNLLNDNIPYIFHAGAFSETKDGIKAMFKGFVIANKLVNGNLKFVLTSKRGAPKLISFVENLISTENVIEKVFFTGELSEPILVKLRRRALLAVVNKPSNWQNDFNFPTKIAELMASGVPMIVSNNGEHMNFLFNEKNAILVNANNENEIASAIVRLYSDPALRGRISEAAIQTAKAYFSLTANEEALSNYFKLFMKLDTACTNY